MTEEQNKQEQAGGQPKSSDLVGELRQLGQQLEELFTATLSSDRARTFQAEVTRGVREIGTQVQQAVKTIQENPKIQEFEERGKRAINEARDTQVFDKFQDTLVKGLSYLNEQVSTLAERLKAEPPTPPTPPTPPQSVPIEDARTGDAPPSTGETTRL